MIWKLALKDLIHEWLLTLCLVMTIASVLAPIISLFSIKNGTIQTLRNRLLADARTRELRPADSRAYTKVMLQQFREYPEVSFLIPMTRQIASSADFAANLSDLNEKPIKRLALIATAGGDPILEAKSLSAPRLQECILTESAAEQLHTKVGDVLQMEVSRHKNSSLEVQHLDVTVTGIVTYGAPSAYISLELIEKVEAYKDGLSVPEFKWPGSTPDAYPVYDGAFVISKKPIAELELLSLTAGTGFTRARLVEQTEVEKILHYPVKSSEFFFGLLDTQKSFVDDASLESLQRLLRGQSVSVLPFVRDLKISNGSQKYSVTAMLPEVGEQLGIPISAEVDSKSETQLKSETIKFPTRFIEKIQENLPVVLRADVAGIIKLSESREIQFEASERKFILSRRGYAGFRMYAETLEAVPRLAEKLRKIKIEVITQEDRIKDVLQLDYYLTQIFWILASIAILGGTAALSASTYSSVERKREPLNVLRLLGVRKSEIMLFPIAQSITMSIAGLGVSMLMYLCLAEVLQRAFGKHINEGEQMCLLTLSNFAYILFGILVISLVSSVAAAIYTTSTEPSEAIRKD